MKTRHIALLGLLLILCAGCTGWDPAVPTSPPDPKDHLEWGTVTRVVDGDTFDVDLDGDGRTDERVRLIGIDTPEIGECYYAEASRRAQALLARQRVGMAPDVRDRDRNGRLLRHVFLPDKSWFNGTMVQEGFARAKRYPPDTTLAPDLEALQDQAIAAARGGWQACDW